MSERLTFERLIAAIEEASQQLTRHAKMAVNTSLTLRNWLIGYYLVEYEQRGADRAAYGTALVNSVSKRLAAASLARVDARELRRYRRFFQVYPEIRDTLSPDLLGSGLLLPKSSGAKWETLSPELKRRGRQARQKRLLIGNSHNFVDLVFYHRILKCHVLIELKVGEFSHEHIGQLNAYVSWYADNEMTEGDSAPIGLLLCTAKDQTVVKYALAGMSNQLFVSRYKVVLPSEEEIRGMLAEVLG